MLLARRLHIRILEFVCFQFRWPHPPSEEGWWGKPFIRFVFRARASFFNDEWNWRPPNLINATRPSLKVVVLRRPKWVLRPKALPPAGWHQLN